MTRRESLAALFAAGFVPELRAGSAANSTLQRLFGSAQGVAVAVDFRTKRLLGAHRLDTARKLVAPPGSTLKPLALMALIDAGKLRPGEAYPCSGKLKIGERSFACVHPRVQVPIDTATAIAYSCNEFVARVAERFQPGELADALTRYGLSSPTHLAGEVEATGTLGRAESAQANQLQALGEDRVTATALEMAIAYHHLAQQAARSQASAILQGLEGAVEFGTAQKAAVPGVKVAGKTGSAGGRWAWFAGFAPSRNPKVVAVVLVQAYSGGADAAPIGGRIIAEHLAGRL